MFRQMFYNLRSAAASMLAMASGAFSTEDQARNAAEGAIQRLRLTPRGSAGRDPMKCGNVRFVIATRKRLRHGGQACTTKPMSLSNNYKDRYLASQTSRMRRLNRELAVQ